MRIYISGAITRAKNPEKDFDRAERYLRDLFPAAEVINPYKVGEALGRTARLSWVEYMTVDLALLRMCDHIYFIRGWEESEGARQERVYATNNGLQEIRIRPKGVEIVPMKTALKRSEVV